MRELNNFAPASTKSMARTIAKSLLPTLLLQIPKHQLGDAQ